MFICLSRSTSVTNPASEPSGFTTGTCEISCSLSRAMTLVKESLIEAVIKPGKVLVAITSVSETSSHSASRKLFSRIHLSS